MKFYLLLSNTVYIAHILISFANTILLSYLRNKRSAILGTWIKNILMYTYINIIYIYLYYIKLDYFKGDNDPV